jgi:hypothetical protein
VAILRIEHPLHHDEPLYLLGRVGIPVRGFVPLSEAVILNIGRVPTWSDRSSMKYGLDGGRTKDGFAPSPIKAPDIVDDRLAKLGLGRCPRQQRSTRRPNHRPTRRQRSPPCGSIGGRLPQKEGFPGGQTLCSDNERLAEAGCL